MKSILRFTPVVACLLLGSSLLLASGPAGVICIVDKVVFEPSEGVPQRIQIWGAFSVATYTTTNVFGRAKAGYMYFSLPANSTAAEIALKEWADLKSVAGTGTGVGFGSAWNSDHGDIRDAKEKPKSPDPYAIGSGVVKIQGNQSIPGISSSDGISGVTTTGGILDQVRQALKASHAQKK